MNGSKWTLGPWRMKSVGSVFLDYRIRAFDSEVAKVTHKRSFDEVTANAHLISAAPDFAEAAEMMIRAEDSGGDDWWGGYDRLVAAYRKARGEQV
jgi:hypothetical protein